MNPSKIKQEILKLAKMMRPFERDIDLRDRAIDARVMLESAARDIDKMVAAGTPEARAKTAADRKWSAECTRRSRNQQPMYNHGEPW